MEIKVWDRYDLATRLVLTLLLLGLSIIPISAGLSQWAAIPIFCAAIAFHVEWKLIVDPATRTYERRTLLRPFGAPQRGSMDEIMCVRVSLAMGQYSVAYYADVLFQPRAKFDDPARFRIASGPLKDVIAQVAMLTKGTRIPVVESNELREVRKDYDSIATLIEKSS
jgi:hypothetical protein